MPTDPLLTFIHISDTHLHADPNFTGDLVDFPADGPVSALVEHLNRLPYHIDFVLHTGDVMTDPEHAEDYERAKEILGQLKHPAFYIPGNHDRPQALQAVLIGRSEAETTAHYDQDLNINGVQIVLLDSSRPESAAGWLADEQFAWFDAVCRADDERPLVVAVHHHVLPLAASWLDEIILENGDALHRRLVGLRHRLRGVFYGHIHEDTVTVRDGIGYYSVRSGWFQTRTWHGQSEPAGDSVHNPTFNVVTLTAQEMTVRSHPVPLPWGTTQPTPPGTMHSV